MTREHEIRQNKEAAKPRRNPLHLRIKIYYGLAAKKVQCGTKFQNNESDDSYRIGRAVPDQKGCVHGKMKDGAPPIFLMPQLWIRLLLSASVLANFSKSRQLHHYLTLKRSFSSLTK